jgi:hypothetical protein
MNAGDLAFALRLAQVVAMATSRNAAKFQRPSEQADGQSGNLIKHT